MKSNNLTLNLNIITVKRINLIFIIMLLSNLSIFAKPASIVERMEPSQWWVDMNNTEVQIMLYGKNIAQSEPSLNVSDLKISRVERTSNPNYLFLYLDIKEAKAGEYNITLNRGRKKEVVKFTLNQRRSGSAERASFDSRDAVYLLMPDRFANGNPNNDNVEGYVEKTEYGNLHERQGGDIKGIIEHLDYIADLGFTALWTTPMFEDNDKNYSYHHYATSNYYLIDPRFGTNEEFKMMIECCHQKGLKYILDIVPNHVNPRHWWHNDLPDFTWYNQWDTFTRTNYQTSAAPDINASEADRKALQDGWFDTNMADINLGNPLFFDYMRQMYVYWIEWANIDGLRVDTYPYNNLDDAARLMKSIRDEYPNLNIVSECWVKTVPEMTYYQSGHPNLDGYDSHMPSVMDFMLKDYFDNVFNEKEGWNSGLKKFYHHFVQDFAIYNPYNVMNFFGNHDMNRFSAAVDRDMDKYKMGLALLAVIRGIPQYYYGDEIMLDGSGDGYEAARRCFPGGWSGDEYNAFTEKGRTKEQQEVHQYLRSILRFRKSSEALTVGKTMHFIPENGIYCIFRYTDNEKVMVLVNNNSEDTQVDLSRFNEMNIIGASANNIVTDTKSTLGGSITLEGKSVTILEITK